MERHGQYLVGIVKGMLHTIGVMNVNVEVQHSPLFCESSFPIGSIATTNQVLNGKNSIVDEAESSGPIGVGVMPPPSPVDGHVGPIGEQQMSSLHRRAGHVLAVPPQQRPSLRILRQVAVLGKPVRVQHVVKILRPRGVGEGRGVVAVMNKTVPAAAATTSLLLPRCCLWQDIFQQIQIRGTVEAFQMTA